MREIYPLGKLSHRLSSSAGRKELTFYQHRATYEARAANLFPKSTRIARPNEMCILWRKGPAAKLIVHIHSSPFYITSQPPVAKQSHPNSRDSSNDRGVTKLM